MSLTNLRTNSLSRNDWFNNFFNETPFDTKISFKKAACNISEDKENFYCEVEAPGFEKKDINISVDNGVLTVSGTHKTEKTEEKTYHLEERVTTSFKRSFSLPKKIHSERIAAKYDSGILTVTLPKAAEGKPKLISID